MSWILLKCECECSFCVLFLYPRANIFFPFWMLSIDIDFLHHVIESLIFIGNLCAKCNAFFCQFSEMECENSILAVILGGLALHLWMKFSWLPVFPSLHPAVLQHDFSYCLAGCFFFCFCLWSKNAEVKIAKNEKKLQANLKLQVP